MAALKDERHEKFAQYIAKGEAKYKSYIKAGYSENGAATSAHRLAKQPAIVARVQELRDAIAQQYIEVVAISHQWIVNEQQDVYKTARANGELETARKTLFDIAKVAGLVIDKQEQTVTNLDEETREQKIARAAALAAELGIAVPDALN